MDFTAAELLTIPGAAAAAVAIVKALTTIGMPTAWARRAAVILGVALLVGATIATDGLTIGVLLAAIPAGISAGLTAVASYDAVRSGEDYVVLRSEDYLAPLGPQ